MLIEENTPSPQNESLGEEQKNQAEAKDVDAVVPKEEVVPETEPDLPEAEVEVAEETKVESPLPEVEAVEETKVEPPSPEVEVTAEARVPEEVSSEAPLTEDMAETEAETLVETAEPETVAEAENLPETVAEVEKPEAPVAEEPETVVSTEQTAPEVTEAVAEEPAVSEESGIEESKAEAPKVEAEPELRVMEELSELVKDDEQFEELLEEANEHEVVLLLKQLADMEDIRSAIPKVAELKHKFDELSNAEHLPNDVIIRFNSALSRFNKRRSEYYRQLEEEKKENSAKKWALIEKLKEIVNAKDALRIHDIREIQNEWRSVGFVLKEDMEPLFNEYKFLLDEFYHQRSLHFEMVEYDQKINLQEKERVISEIEGLIPTEVERNDSDIWRERQEEVAKLRQEWKTIGHVPKEDLERINQEYRAVMTRFFEGRQEFFESLDQMRAENQRLKEALLEQMDAYTQFESGRAKEWNEKTKGLLVLQEEWNKIGRAPKEVNQDLWDRYRAIFDTFFSNKAAFFKSFDDERKHNLDLKRELVNKAEELIKGKEFEKIARELKRIQSEWKKIGPVPDRHSNKIWKRFRGICDSFFEQRRGHYEVVKEEEVENLQKKKNLIKALQETLSEVPAGGIDGAIEKIQQAQEEWKAIGHVPMKDKDVIWQEFRAVIDTFFNSLESQKKEVRLAKLRTSMDMMDDNRKRTQHLQTKISRIQVKIDKSRAIVDQYSINIQYISKGKSGDPLREQIQQQIDDEKKRIEKWEKEIREIKKLMAEARSKPKKEEKEEKVQAAPAAEPKAEAQADATVEEKPKVEPASVESLETETPSPEANETENEEIISDESTTNESADESDENTGD
jgi:hypothetical protein